MSGQRWQITLIIAVLLWGTVGQAVSTARADEAMQLGDPVILTPEHFQQPLCMFVRSQECPQAVSKTEPACNFQYEYYGPDGLYHPACGEKLLRMLPEDVPVLIIVHGSFVDFEEEPELLQAFEYVRQAAPDQPLLVICYRWPSAIGCKALLGSIAVCQLAQRAEFNGFYLAQLINTIPANNSVRLMGHSHGCRMIASALHLLCGGRVDRKQLPPSAWSNRGMRVTFFSAALDHDWLNPGERYDRAIHRICWLQNHRHSLDWALLTYPWRYPGSSRALGQCGFTKTDLRKLGAQAAKIEQYSEESKLRWGHGLKSHLKNPAIRPVVISNVLSPCPCQ